MSYLASFCCIEWISIASTVAQGCLVNHPIFLSLFNPSNMRSCASIVWKTNCKYWLFHLLQMTLIPSWWIGLPLLPFSMVLSWPCPIGSLPIQLWRVYKLKYLIGMLLAYYPVSNLPLSCGLLPVGLPILLVGHITATVQSYVCPSHHSFGPTLWLEGVHTSVHVCLSTWLPMSAPSLLHSCIYHVYTPMWLWLHFQSTPDQVPHLDRRCTCIITYMHVHLTPETCPTLLT